MEPHHQPKIKTPEYHQTDLTSEGQQRLYYWSVGIIIITLLSVTFYVLYIADNHDANDITDPSDEEVSEVANDDMVFEEKTMRGDSHIINYEVPVGDTAVAIITRDNINRLVQEFADQADLDRNIELAETGQLPLFMQRPYTLDITNEYYINTKFGTTSVVSTNYIDTGGSNGFGSFDAYTIDTNNNRLNALADIVKITDQSKVKEVVVTALEKQIFADTVGEQVLFPESLQNISLRDIEFALSQQDLILFFDQYEIGPGSLGSITVKIPIYQIGQYINLPNNVAD